MKNSTTSITLAKVEVLINAPSYSLENLPEFLESWRDMRCVRDGNVGELFLSKPKSLEAIKNRTCFVAALRGRFSSAITKHIESRGTADHVLWVKEKDPLPAGNPDFPWLFLVLEGTLIYEDFCLELDIVGDDVDGLLVVDCQREMVTGPLKGIRSLEPTPLEVVTLVPNSVPSSDRVLSLAKTSMGVNPIDHVVNRRRPSSESFLNGESSRSPAKDQGREVEDGERVDSPNKELQDTPHFESGGKEAHVSSSPLKSPRDDEGVAPSPFKEDRVPEIRQALTAPANQVTNEATQGLAVQAQHQASHHPGTDYKVQEGKLVPPKVDVAKGGQQQKNQKSSGKGQKPNVSKNQAEPRHTRICKFGLCCRIQNCQKEHGQPHPDIGLEWGKKRKRNNAPKSAQRSDSCGNGAMCLKPGCKYIHPPDPRYYPTRLTDCPFGRTCRRFKGGNCVYKHTGSNNFDTLGFSVNILPNPRRPDHDAAQYYDNDHRNSQIPQPPYDRDQRSPRYNREEMPPPASSAEASEMYDPMDSHETWDQLESRKRRQEEELQAGPFVRVKHEPEQHQEPQPLPPYTETRHGWEYVQR